MPLLPAQLSVPARFTLVRQIGEGGMGVVYEALDVERNVHVALKTLRYHDPDALARFKHEFRALQGIHHPNLVALGELVGDPRGPFFTMELVDGVDLFEWVCGASTGKERSGGATAADARGESNGVEGDPEAPGTPPLASHKRASTFPREGGRFDEARLRDAFRQIAQGLSALHDAGRIHRDVKPSNVRVTPEGRVVLLDFGLVFEVDAKQATDTNVVGTPAYMAPEQAMSDPVGPEADWYAVGAMLYLCLTGRLPFEGAAVAVLMAKHYQEPPAPSTVAKDVPRDLEQLCMDMLQFEPSSRPNGREVWRRLSSRSSRPPAPSQHPIGTAPVSTPFVGRVDEISALRRALEDVVREKRAVSVVVHGESGVGKSSLARRFLDEVKEADQALVLTGRCYEREAVPYKAFDEVIDTLSRRLARLPKEESLALLPSRVEALAQLFPALGRVPVVAQASGVPDRDPHQRRRGAFRALRELLRKVSARQTLVIAIDDLQWTDADSLSLLTELLRPPDAPPLLLVVTMRSGEDATHPSAPPKLAAEIPGDVRAVHVGRLAKEDARELATQLLERGAGVDHADAVAIAREADGHPLFIDELVRHAKARGSEAPGALLRLDDALWTRVARLDLSARRVLEVACLLGAPVAQEVVATAAALEMDDFARAVALLRAANLVRTGGARVTDAIEPFHDRVREAVAARLDPDAKRECHVRLASALELAKGSDPEVLSTHWAGAGEPAKAARHAIGAAEQAAQTLAFDRAARLFQRAIDLVPSTDPRMRGLREQLGDALANAGKPAAAAAEYERAAEGASAVDALDLRRRAAEQLLRAGEVRRGMAATRDVLTAVGLAMPRTRFGVIVSLLWFRLLLRLRGFRFEPREAKDVPAAELLRVDVCWSVSCSLTYADPFFAALFQARHLVLALRARERLRVVRALAIEGGFTAAAGESSWRRAESALVVAREAARGCTDPYAEAIVTACEGLAFLFTFRFTRAIEPLESAAATFRERCPGTRWEIATVRYFSFLSQFFACRFDVMREAQEAALKDAVESGDRYAAVMLRVGTVNRGWLLTGDSARARRELETASREWPEKPFHVVHYYALISKAYVELFDGHPERALELFQSNRRALRRLMILELDGPKLEYAGISGRVALGVALSASGAKRGACLREVDRCIRVFERRPCPVSLASLLSLRAGRAAVRGDREEALAHLEELAREEAEELWLAAQCARWVIGKTRGAEGGEQVRAAEVELASRGVMISRSLVATQLPGLERYLE
ncbi:MAG: serine/threonine-protein kinase PknK [Polyangiaceae bacterium]